jgi:hypothetical protein
MPMNDETRLKTIQEILKIDMEEIMSLGQFNDEAHKKKLEVLKRFESQVREDEDLSI